MLPSRVADVVVIGGGIMGCSTAYYLAKAGARVLLLEQTGIAAEASGRNFGGLQQQFRLDQDMPLAIEALALWGTFDEELGFPTEFVRTGTLAVALSESEMEVLEGTVERHRRWGLTIEVLSGPEARVLLPPLTERAVGATYCPDDGHVNPLLATRAFARAAERLGVEIVVPARVTGFQVRSGRIRAVETAEGTVTTESVVVTAGRFMPELAALVGVEVPHMLSGRLQVMVTERTAPAIAPYVIANHGLFRQAVAGQIHISAANISGRFVRHPTPDAFTIEHDSTRTAARRFLELFPAFRGLRILRIWGATLAKTLDDVPIIERLGRPQGLVLAGFGYGGFTIGPVIGKLASELALGQEPHLPLAAFQLDRFSRDLERRQYNELSPVDALLSEGPARVHNGPER